MEADELELLDKSVRHALASAPDADDALEAIGWSDVLAAEPRDAVSVVFGALGDLNAVASSLDDVDARRPGRRPPLPAGRSRCPPSADGTRPASSARRRPRRRRSRARARVHGATRSRCPRRDGDPVIVAIVPTDDDRTHGDRGHRPPRSGCHGSRRRGATGRHRDPRPRSVGRRADRRPARARHRARGHRARDAPPRPRARARPASSSVDRSPSSRPSGTAWPRPTSRSRRATPRSSPRGMHPTR